MGEDAPLNQERWEREFALKERELRLKERQVGVWHNPVFLGLLAAALALAGNISVTWYQGRTAERQAHVKAQSDLVVEVIKTGDPQRAAKNLVFLVHLGLLDDPDGKMQAALSHPDDVPVLPAAQGHADGGYGQKGYGVGGYGGERDRPPH